ncbi:DUF4395 domain-containing protein [Thiothrix sp.]|jgi:hypothetical protein|uniref:DUF4395 domain-containing protein n=1 Tax=Thiothrix sp. TaxID=1032 RepID=UPI00257FEDB1|nr:DUF4395 domain-containing protein [Thiothrix sp.]
MNNLLRFGDTLLPGYAVPVLNEREVRAAAGILFFFAIVTFMNAFLMGNFYPTRVFIVAFVVDFMIRLFVNPQFAPSMILGHFAVRNQTPEYVGAPQKRFAWGIGLALGLLMLYLMVLNNVVGPINMLVCSACMLLMFFEAAFGICLGCKVYNLFFREKAKFCPGDACEANTRHDIQKIGMAHFVSLLVVLGLIGVVGQQLDRSSPTAMGHHATQKTSPEAAVNTDNDDCTPPEWAIKMGHGDMWKQHHDCE